MRAISRKPAVIRESRTWTVSFAALNASDAFSFSLLFYPASASSGIGATPSCVHE